jgi:L-asparaginase/Glu-tRNA(Gln) amidotransferase subunit D
MAPPISRPGFELDGQAVYYNTSAMVAYSVGTVVRSHGAGGRVSGARRPVVTLLRLGGTIAMGTEHGPGVVPQLDAAELAAAIGAAADGVDLRAHRATRTRGVPAGRLHLRSRRRH